MARRCFCRILKAGAIRVLARAGNQAGLLPRAQAHRGLIQPSRRPLPSLCRVQKSAGALRPRQMHHRPAGTGGKDAGSGALPPLPRRAAALPK